MPRRKRMYLPGLPYHVVQRGNNREACFFEFEDYQYYLSLLEEVSERYRVQVHCFVLMTNHVHLLLTPEDDTGISQLTKVVGSRYAFYMNRRYKRTGTMWEGRHKSSAVESNQYLLKCYRYIEMNPVTANMVERPEEYRWSSYGPNAWGDHSALISPHEVYLKLGGSEETRQIAYRTLFKERISELDLEEIRRVTHYCQPLGSDYFRKQIEAKTGISLGYQRRGWPKKIG